MTPPVFDINPYVGPLPIRFGTPRRDVPALFGVPARPSKNGDWEMLAAERPTGLFSRQLVLGDNLDLDRLEARYDAGVLRLTVPVAERAKPRKIEVTTGGRQETTAIGA